MAIRFAKVDADLDSHPKIRRAGRNGREVFLFVLRRNAALDRSGRVPASYIEPWYLADQLMMSEEDARDGVDRAIAAGLVTVVSGHGRDCPDASVEIVGWDDDWSKAPLDEAERKRRQRERVRAAGAAAAGQVNPPTSQPVTDVSGQLRDNRDRPDSHASEEKRVDQREEVGPDARAGAAPQVDRSRFVDRRSAVTHAGWSLAASEHARLRASGVDASARAFPGLPVGHGAGELAARVLELTAGDTPDYAHAERQLAHVVAVRVAEAERTRSLRWFAASTMWGKAAFWRAIDMSVEDARTGPPAREAGAPRARGGRGADTRAGDLLEAQLARVAAAEAEEANGGVG